MSARLAKTVDAAAYTDPSVLERFFTEDDLAKIRTQYLVPRETPAIGQPGRSCETNLFFGFFFDGTRNHYGLSEQRGDHTHSNVARLFDAYPGQTIAPQAMLNDRVRWPNEAAYPNYFRIYMPGVGTPCEKIE